VSDWSRRRIGGALTGAAILAVLGPAAGLARAASRTHEVAIRGFRFDPARLTVLPGDRVSWINHDLAPHTATGAGWDTRGLARAAAAEIAFAEPGRFAYSCAFHPMMTGEIVVVAGPG